MKLFYPLYLASQSPRRKQILTDNGISFQTLDVLFDESFSSLWSPDKIVTHIAQKKWELAFSLIDQKLPLQKLILTADTIVFLDKNAIGKPKDWDEAFKILSLLSGKTHQVYTGFSLGGLDGSLVVNDYDCTSVTFKRLSTQQIENYIQLGSCFDKAGAYGIQDDEGRHFVANIEGSINNVIGLPIEKIKSILLTKGWAQS